MQELKKLYIFWNYGMTIYCHEKVFRVQKINYFWASFLGSMSKAQIRGVFYLRFYGITFPRPPLPLFGRPSATRIRESKDRRKRETDFEIIFVE